MTTDRGYKDEFAQLARLTEDIADDLTVCSRLDETTVAAGLRFGSFIAACDSLVELTARLNTVALRADGPNRTLHAWKAGI